MSVARWRVGDGVLVRGRRCTIVTVTASADCIALGLREIGGIGRQTLLIPFDRPRPLEAHRVARVVRPRRWLHDLDRALIRQHPFGSLRAAARSTIRLMPYQLEPALAVLRDGVTRLLLADEVGLGKTIQAGLVLLELASQTEAFRALVLVPAGLREQWLRELSTHFGVGATLADAAWLRSSEWDRPPDVNPWSLPGILVASHDFVKRPEVLRPLEDVTWDLVVIDEAHAATTGTDRRAGLHAIACRSRRVMLLTATPHVADRDEFTALRNIGRLHDEEAPALFLRRLRSEVGGGRPRRSLVLSVASSDAERSMHDLLDRYSRQIWEESEARGDDRGRLVSIVLRKRALSGAGSLAASILRRIRLLANQAETGSDASQMKLPLGDDERLDDEEPDAMLAAPGLADSRRERRLLAAVAQVAQRAAGSETKARYLVRLLGRIREPVVVFTEYRDTLRRLEQRLATTGRSIVLLHGGMTPAERNRAERIFNAGADALLATDAAAEGLNLHYRCRVVIHYELPWNPLRFEQRAGRVDRFGQSRRVHEIALVARDTAERLVLAPLMLRASRVRPAATHPAMLDVLTESHVARLVMSAGPTVVSGPSEPAEVSETRMRQEAIAEAARLERHRSLIARSETRSARGDRQGPFVTSLRKAGSVPRGLVAFYVVTLSALDGERIHAEIVVLHLDLQGGETAFHATPAGLRTIVRLASPPVNARLAARLAAIAARAREPIAARARAARLNLAGRERALAGVLASAAQRIVQPGLFDRRPIRDAERRDDLAAAQRDETRQRLATLSSASDPISDVDLIAALIVGQPRALR
jgi:superfamily II DNA or RNA helicase